MIGITGGIASGKSTVAKRLKELGAIVLDADQISREVVELKTPGWEQVKLNFPEVIQVDGEINRNKLAKIIFQDPPRRLVLEGIIHPLVKEKLLSEKKALIQEQRPFFAEVPLLYEVGWDSWIQPIWVVYVRAEIQLHRLITRTNLAQEAALQRINAQMSLEEKAQKAQVIIDNNGTLSETFAQVDALWEKLCRGY